MRVNSRSFFSPSRRGSRSKIEGSLFQIQKVLAGLICPREDWRKSNLWGRERLLKVPLILRRSPVNPWLGNAGIHPDEMEPCFQGKLAIQLRIAYMVVLLSREARLNVWETLFMRYKTHLDAVFVPNGLLYWKRTV